MQVALGRSDSDEIRNDLHKVSKLLCGDAGLCVTNMSKEEAQRIFNEYDFARTGRIFNEWNLKKVLWTGSHIRWSHSCASKECLCP
ncbi:putative ribosomal protein L10-like domain superfamily [Helianthus debilis subsp. tardiflorus]